MCELLICQNIRTSYLNEYAHKHTPTNTQINNGIIKYNKKGWSFIKIANGEYKFTFYKIRNILEINEHIYNDITIMSFCFYENIFYILAVNLKNRLILLLLCFAMMDTIYK